jgi:general secretion pathway protein G
MHVLTRAKTESARSQIQDLSGALDHYRFEVGRYPTSAEGLNGLLRAPPGVAGWKGPYIKKQAVPDDPWGNAYRYRSPGEYGPYDLYSLGQDNADGGEGEGQDVFGWE